MPTKPFIEVDLTDRVRKDAGTAELLSRDTAEKREALLKALRDANLYDPNLHYAGVHRYEVPELMEKGSLDGELAGWDTTDYEDYAEFLKEFRGDFPDAKVSDYLIAAPECILDHDEDDPYMPHPLRGLRMDANYCIAVYDGSKLAEALGNDPVATPFCHLMTFKDPTRKLDALVAVVYLIYNKDDAKEFGEEG